MRKPPPPVLTVYYDGACPLCSAEIDHYKRCEGAERLSFVDVSVENPGDGLDQAEARARFHVRGPDGTLASGAAAFARLWHALPRWRWLGRLVAAPLAASLAEAVYKASLPLRPHLARLLRRHLE